MPALLHLEELSFRQLEQLDRTKTIFFLAVSPLEEHGPHLPVGVDIFNAQYLTERVANQFLARQPDWTAVLCPALALGANVLRFVGSVQVRQKTLRDLLIDYGASLTTYGFKYLILVSAHGGPGHVVALEEAADKVSRKSKIKMICLTSAMIYRFLTGQYLNLIEQHLGRPLTETERNWLKHDFHSGWWETSMMLKLKPGLVDPSYRTLPPVLVQLKDVRSRKIPRIGNGLGYMGVPHLASVEFAEATSAAFTALGLDILLRLSSGTDVSKDIHSTFYKALVFRVGFRRAMLVIITLAILAAIFFWK